MSQPLLATARILIPYVATGQTHKLAAYVRNLQVDGASWNINTRETDSNDLDWADAAQGYWLAMSYGLDDAISPPTAELQELTGVTWNTLDTFACTGGNGSNSTILASQFTLTLRDMAFKKLRVVLLDTINGAMFRYTTSAGPGGFQTNYAKQWDSTFDITNAPYRWQVSRGDRFLAASPFVSIVSVYNDRLRRDRGLG